MELSLFLKSVIEQDTAPVVICNLKHEIIYMNPTAIRRYEKRGGKELIGKSLLLCHNDKSNEKIKQVVEWFAKNQDNNVIFTYHNCRENRDVYMVALRYDNGQLIGYYEKHEYRTPESDR